jgi:hypothetical protein
MGAVGHNGNGDSLPIDMASQAMACCIAESCPVILEEKSPWNCFRPQADSASWFPVLPDFTHHRLVFSRADYVGKGFIVFRCRVRWTRQYFGLGLSCRGMVNRKMGSIAER